jgi:hypothetical protein
MCSLVVTHKCLEKGVCGFECSLYTIFCMVW